MDYKLLGRSGLRVSELALGTMTFGQDWGWGAAPDECRAMYEAYRAAGGNFIDTADIYTNGSSERIVGDLVATEREHVVVATKYTMSTDRSDPNAGGNHRKHLVQALDASLRRLRLDYVDVLWLHAWDFLTPVDEVMRALDDQVRAGKVLYAGVSDAPAWVVAQANTLADAHGWAPFVALQVDYSLVQRTPELELLPMAHALDLAVTPWGPLGSGVLSGKYDEHGAATGGDAARRPGAHRLTGRNLRIAMQLKEVAAELGEPPAAVAIAWLLTTRSRPGDPHRGRAARGPARGEPARHRAAPARARAAAPGRGKRYRAHLPPALSAGRRHAPFRARRHLRQGERPPRPAAALKRGRRQRRREGSTLEPELVPAVLVAQGHGHGLVVLRLVGAEHAAEQATIEEAHDVRVVDGQLAVHAVVHIDGHDPGVNVVQGHVVPRGVQPAHHRRGRQRHRGVGTVELLSEVFTVHAPHGEGGVARGIGGHVFADDAHQETREPLVAPRRQHDLQAFTGVGVGLGRAAAAGAVALARLDKPSSVSFSRCARATVRCRPKASPISLAVMGALLSRSRR